MSSRTNPVLLAPNRRIDRVCIIVIDAAFVLLFLLFLLIFLLLLMLPPCRHAKGSQRVQEHVVNVHNPGLPLEAHLDLVPRRNQPHHRACQSPAIAQRDCHQEPTCTVSTDAPAAELAYSNTESSKRFPTVIAGGALFWRSIVVVSPTAA